MAKTNYCVYVHVNKDNGKVYVGISKNPLQRWCKNGTGYGDGCFGKAIQKYGWDNFEHIILETDLTCKEARVLERLYIIALDAKVPNGYNICDGGEGAFGYRFTHEQRVNLSKRMTGRTHSLKSRLKISKSKKGVSFSEEHKKSLSEARNKMLKEKVENGERLPAKRIPVLQYDKTGNFIQRFDSIDDAAKTLRIGHINDVCYGRRKSAGGYIWKMEVSKDGAH